MAGQYIPSHGAALPSQYFPLPKQTRTVSPKVQPPYSSKGQCWWGRETVPLWWGARGPCQCRKGAFGVGFSMSYGAGPPKRSWNQHSGCFTVMVPEPLKLCCDVHHCTDTASSHPSHKTQSPCRPLHQAHTQRADTLPSGCAQERCQPCYVLSNLLNNGIILALRADILWIN